MGRPTFWTEDRQKQLILMLRMGMNHRKIAAEFGVSKAAITLKFKHLRKEGFLDAYEDDTTLKPIARTEDPQARASAVRRGFDVPKEKMGEYLDLLKKGMPITEARKRLGL